MPLANVIQCVLVNARSIVNKWRNLTTELFVNAQPFIIVITKTWLKHDFEDHMFNLNGYCNIRCNRINKYGDGVMLLARDSLGLQQVNVKPKHILFSNYFNFVIGDLKYI